MGQQLQAKLHGVLAGSAMLIDDSIGHPAPCQCVMCGKVRVAEGGSDRTNHSLPTLVKS